MDNVDEVGETRWGAIKIKEGIYEVKTEADKLELMSLITNSDQYNRASIRMRISMGIDYAVNMSVIKLTEAIKEVEKYLDDKIIDIEILTNLVMIYYFTDENGNKKNAFNVILMYKCVSQKTGKIVDNERTMPHSALLIGKEHKNLVSLIDPNYDMDTWDTCGLKLVIDLEFKFPAKHNIMTNTGKQKNKIYDTYQEIYNFIVITIKKYSLGFHMRSIIFDHELKQYVINISVKNAEMISDPRYNKFMKQCIKQCVNLKLNTTEDVSLVKVEIIIP
jgi:hypothetical protein